MAWLEIKLWALDAFARTIGRHWLSMIVNDRLMTTLQSPSYFNFSLCQIPPITLPSWALDLSHEHSKYTAVAAT
jgi:hypothetical protein